MYKVLNMITRKYKYKITELLPKNKQLSNKRDNFMYNNTVLKLKRIKGISVNKVYFYPHFNLL